MRGSVQDIHMLVGTSDVFFLEKETIGYFLRWIMADPNRSSLIPNTWDIRVFRHQLQGYRDYRKRRRQLMDLGIQVDDSKLHPSDSIFVDEVERTYFSGSVNSREMAEFYVLIRRSVGNGWVNIISQDRSFERIPMANTVFIGTEPRTGNNNLPAQFDFLRDFNIHAQLANRIRTHIGVSPNGLTIQEAIVELEDYLQSLTGLGTDGRSLMEQAFRQDGAYRKLNPLTDPNPQHSQQNEQRGFRELYCATWTGLRNPLAHEGVGSAFAGSRYPDAVTLLKYLGFLSILFERADGPLP